MDPIEIVVSVNTDEKLDGKVLEGIVDEDIKNFEEWFKKKLGNPALADPEKAIIKTYLWHKLHPEETD